MILCEMRFQLTIYTTDKHYDQYLILLILIMYLYPMCFIYVRMFIGAIRCTAKHFVSNSQTYS